MGGFLPWRWLITNGAFLVLDRPTATSSTFSVRSSLQGHVPSQNELTSCLPALDAALGTLSKL